MSALEYADYRVSESPVYLGKRFARYATAESGIYVEVLETPRDSDEIREEFRAYLEGYSIMRDKLAEKGLENYISEIVDSDSDDFWIVYGVPEGCYPILEVLSTHANGIDGRDWAWMLRRVLAVMATAERAANISPQSFLVHPEGHGIVLLDWDHAGEKERSLDQLTELMAEILTDSTDSQEQRRFMAMSANYRSGIQKAYSKGETSRTHSFHQTLDEYDLKISRLYGRREFRPFALDPELSTPFLEEERTRLTKGG